ncbi:hypothetical protein Q0M94_04400 [Deinococcus radiomollis]|uniref:hypothetical protein n=1 Tax=Deinococcus radiomollis TaxID=468916 RepID=UPI003892B4DF
MTGQASQTRSAAETHFITADEVAGSTRASNALRNCVTDRAGKDLTAVFSADADTRSGRPGDLAVQTPPVGRHGSAEP